MQFTRRANRLMVSHVTGPTHNFLEFTFDRSSDGTPLIVFDQPSENWPLEAVKKAVLDGIAEGGDCNGMVVRSVRLLGSDTPTIPIYRRLARSLIEHMRQETQFKQIEALG